MQLMNAYFSATRRQLGKDDCISIETNPKLHPSLLELPSHPVWRENDSLACTHAHTGSDWCTRAYAVLADCFPVRSFAKRTNSDETERSRCCGNGGGVEGVQGATNRRAGSGTHFATPPAKSRKDMGPSMAPATWEPAKYHRKENNVTSEMNCAKK